MSWLLYRKDYHSLYISRRDASSLGPLGGRRCNRKVLSRVGSSVLNTSPSGTKIVFVVDPKMPQLGRFHEAETDAVKTGYGT